MSREIKFRAWVHVLEDDINGMFNVVSFSGDRIRTTHHDKLKEEDGLYDLMQYTGLKDKNGVEIYEGDIVTEYGFRGEATVTHPVVYYKNGFYLDDFLHSNWNSEDVQVIGNIYENPELLI